MSNPRRGDGAGDAKRTKEAKQGPWTEERVRLLLQQLDESGEQVASFARRHGFKAQRLHWWMSKLGWKRTRPLFPGGPPPPDSASAAPQFLPLRVVADGRLAAPVPSRPEAGVVVELGQRHIRVEAHFDAEVLRRVVQLLEQVPPC
jgi:hypothetical protein